MGVKEARCRSLAFQRPSEFFVESVRVNIGPKSYEVLPSFVLERVKDKEYKKPYSTLVRVSKGKGELQRLGTEKVESSLEALVFPSVSIEESAFRNRMYP